MTTLSLANAQKPAWWYSWLSSRDRFNSSIFDAYLASATGAAPPPRGPAGPWRFAKEVVTTIAGRLTAWRYPAASSPDFRATVVVVAPAAATALREDNAPYRDTYFGPLLDDLRAHGERPLFIGLPVVEQRKTIRALGRRGDIPAASIAHYFTLFDIAVAAWRVATTKFNRAGLRLPNGANAAPLLDREFSRERGPIMFGMLVERAMWRVLAHHSDARVIHTYENNPWERAIDRAAHEARPRRDVVGYLHCAVLPSHLKNAKAPEENAIRPEPDRIVCTGAAARDIFLRLGSHNPARIVPGCALRGPSFDKLACRAGPPRPIQSVLVVLEGLTAMTKLLQFVTRAMANLPGKRILLRPHPTMPLSVLLPLAGIELDPAAGLDESRASSLEDAIAEVDAVIYQSSTAALTAMAMGVPLLKISLPGPLEDDSLFGCDALKRVAARPEELATALAYFEQMPQATFEAECEAGRAHLHRLMAPINEANLAPFLQSPSAGESLAVQA